MDYAEKMQRYVEALEEERRKILVFQRELPLCLELVTQAIEAYRRELSGTTTEYNTQGQSECSEQTWGENGPVSEEFIPIKTTTTTTTTSKEGVPRKAVVTEVKGNGNGGAFQLFQRDKSAVGKNNNNENVHNSAHQNTTVEEKTVGSGGGGTWTRKEDQMKERQRKLRRCWSPELHRRFLQALQQLGGSLVATPKQIRELMKVDGLTNDEVKSHLQMQKYRLHTRRPSPTIHNEGNPQTPQFVVVGGIWVPPPKYAAMAATTASVEMATIGTANRIYAPVATAAVPPQPSAMPQTQEVSQKPDQKQHLQVVSQGRGSQSAEDHANPNSPTSSSSTHTTTSSPVY